MDGKIEGEFYKVFCSEYIKHQDQATVTLMEECFSNGFRAAASLMREENIELKKKAQMNIYKSAFNGLLEENKEVSDDNESVAVSFEWIASKTTGEISEYAQDCASMLRLGVDEFLKQAAR